MKVVNNERETWTQTWTRLRHENINNLKKKFITWHGWYDTNITQNTQTCI